MDAGLTIQLHPLLMLLTGKKSLIFSRKTTVHGMKQKETTLRKMEEHFEFEHTTHKLMGLKVEESYRNKMRKEIYELSWKFFAPFNVKP